MEEQTADIEVTVKTLDSQSRTYTVGPQVNSPVRTVNSGVNYHFQSAFVVVWLTSVPSFFVVDSERVQGAHCPLSGYPCGQTEADLPGQSLTGWKDSGRLQ